MTWKDTTTRRDTSRAELTPEEQATVNDVLDAAVAWQRGELDFPAAMSIGTMLDGYGQSSPAYTRWKAIWHAVRAGDPRWKALHALVDILPEKEGFVVTRQGVYSRAEIAANEAGWQYANFERTAA